MDQPRNLLDVKPWARTSVIGAAAIGVLGFVQSALLGQAGIVTVVAGASCVVLAVILNAWVAWDEARKRAIPAASAALTMTAYLKDEAGSVVGYAFPVTKRHLMTSEAVVLAASGESTLSDELFLKVIWMPPGEESREVVVTPLPGGYVLLTLMPELKLPRQVKRASLVRRHVEKALVVAEAWHGDDIRELGGRAHAVGGHNRVVNLDDEKSATGDELIGAPLLQDGNQRVVGVLDGMDDKGRPRYLPLTQDKARELVGGASWWRSTGWVVPVAVTAAVALLAAIQPVVSFGDIGGLGPAECKSEATTLNVVVSTEKDGLIRQMAADFEDDFRGEDGVCADVEVFGVNSGEATEAIAKGWVAPPDERLKCPADDPENCEVVKARKPDLWLPTESVWPKLLAAGELGDGGPDQLAEHEGEWTSVASSILTILMPEAKREKLSASPDWDELVTKAAREQLAIAIDDPIGSTSGMATSVALNEALVAEHGEDPAVGLLRDAIASVPEALAGEDITRLMDRVYQDTDLLEQMDAVVAQEQTAYIYNCKDPLGSDDFSCDSTVEDKGRRMVAVAPNDTIYGFDHPAVPMASLDSDDAKREVSEAFVEYLTTDEAQKMFREWGFREAGKPGQATKELEDVVSAVDVDKVTDWPEPRNVNKWRQQWKNVRLPVRVLLSVDTSGSMEQIDGQDRRVALEGFTDVCTGKVTDNPTYLQVAKSAALNAIGELEDERDSVALDPFPPAGTDTTTKIMPLSGPTRSQLKGKVCGLEAFGETPLYDALRDANASIEAAETETSDRTVIVLLSDGGQNPPQDFDALMEEVGGEGAVPVIAVGIGDQAPIDELSRLTEGTGGALRNLSAPGDVANLDHVLVDVFQGLAGKVS
ncbi:MAG: substrate-binding and vWA domain-containing protein [Rubrobacteraceae bacterium]